MSRIAALAIVFLAASCLPACATPPANEREMPAFVGTWHVLIHYREPQGRFPERWKWDERVWIIEPAPDGGGYDWVEHAMVNLQDQTDRFEKLGTPMARRLLGAWEPNAAQREEIENGITVSSRGMRRKRLESVEPGLWQSPTEANTVGRSSSGIGYHEVWSIREDGEGTHFRIESRFAVSATGGDERGGLTVYQAEESGTARFQGRYHREDERVGRFEVSPTRILVQAPTRPRMTSLPGPAGPIKLVPDNQIQSRVPLILTVLRPFHYYRSRQVTVDSTPPGAELDLAYLRRGSQLMYHRGQAPLEVVLPTRLQSASADRLLIRGFLPGHERTRMSLSIDELGNEELVLELPPLPNQVTAVLHGSLAGRSVLELRSDEPPTLRVSEDAGGYTVVLVRTGLESALSEQLSTLDDPQLEVDARQLGNDLVLRLGFGTAGPLELRHRSTVDPVRGGARTRIELEGEAAAGRSERLLAAVASMEAPSGDVCQGAWEQALRVELSDRELSGLLGRDDHPYRATLRAALRRLAELSPDRTLHTTGGTALVSGSPLEFELAWSRSAEIDGYLRWLHDVAQRIEPEDEGTRAFRSMVAPGWEVGRFDRLLASARTGLEQCQRGVAIPTG